MSGDFLLEMPVEEIREFRHPPRALGKNLVRVPVCLHHGMKAPGDKFHGCFLMEKIGHAVYENLPRFFPVQQKLQFTGMLDKPKFIPVFFQTHGLKAFG